MISRNSFWVSIKENSKRRLWVIALLFLAFFFYFPVVIGLMAENYSTEILRASEIEKIWKTEQMIDNFQNIIGVDVSGTFLVIGAAILCALQGFSYLYNRKKVDFYHALPISKGRRFSTIYVNGIGIFCGAYFINLCLGVIVGSLFGMVTPAVIMLAIKGMIFNLLLFISVYSITLIAAFLTGNIIVAFLATGVLLVYEIAVRFLYVLLVGQFFETYSYYSEELVSHTVTSPIIIFIVKILHLSSSTLNPAKETMQGVIILIGYIIIYTAIGYILYAKRPLENSGKAMAFPLTKRVIKLLLMIPLSLGVGTIFYSISNNSMVAIYIGCILGIIIFQGLLQVIYEFDMKAIMKEKKDVIIVAVVAIGIIMIFQFDFIGYDSYIPDQSELESVSMQLSDGVYYENYKDDENTTWVSDWQYYDTHMYYTDTDKIIALVSQSVEESMLEEDVLYLSIDIQYRLKNGKSKFRSIDIPWEENMVLLDEIFTSEEYQVGYYQIFNEYYIENQQISSVEFQGNLLSYKIKEEEINEFLEIYKEELTLLSYKDVCNEIPLGAIMITIADVPGANGNNNSYFSYPVYDTFENTLEFLEKDERFTTVNVVANQVESVLVSIQQEETYQEISYTEEVDIEEILDKIIPYHIENYMASRYQNGMQNSYWYFDGRVILKEMINDTSSINGTFYKDDLPEVISESIYLN